MCDELGIAEVSAPATKQAPAMRLVTAGQAVPAMVLNGRGFVNQQLYLPGSVLMRECAILFPAAVLWSCVHMEKPVAEGSHA
jgi:hypothetical protein